MRSQKNWNLLGAKMSRASLNMRQNLDHRIPGDFWMMLKKFLKILRKKENFPGVGSTRDSSNMQYAVIPPIHVNFYAFSNSRVIRFIGIQSFLGLQAHLG